MGLSEIGQIYDLISRMIAVKRWFSCLTTAGYDTPVNGVTIELLNRVTTGVVKKAKLLARFQASFMAYYGM